MPRPVRCLKVPPRRSLFGLTLVIAGLMTAAVVGIAVAKTFTLNVAKSARVTNTSGVTSRANIVVNTHGFAVYTLSGDSQNHPKCTKANGCFRFWPPVKVASSKNLSKASGISGRLGVWHRDGFLQLTLGGHPLYTFSGDAHKATATGEGLQSFGGTWHVSKAASSKAPATGTGTTSTPAPSMPAYPYSY
jgi:predicted lipoprotein with Yx(FWY)xxD motif